MISGLRITEVSLLLFLLWFVICNGILYITRREDLFITACSTGNGTGLRPACSTGLGTGLRLPCANRPTTTTIRYTRDQLIALRRVCTTDRDVIARIRSPPYGAKVISMVP